MNKILVCFCCITALTLLVACSNKDKQKQSEAKDKVHLIDGGEAQISSSTRPSSSSSSSSTTQSTTTSESSDTKTELNPLGETPNNSAYDGSQDFAAHFAIVFVSFDSEQIKTLLPHVTADVKVKMDEITTDQSKQKVEILTPESAASYEDGRNVYVFSFKSEDGKRVGRIYIETSTVDNEAKISDLSFGWY